MLARRKAIDPAWAASASVAVQDRVMELTAFVGASTVGCYMAVGAEVRTDAIVEECRRAGKTVAVPVWRRETGSYGMARLEHGAAMARGPLGIHEPASPELVETVELILVPGVAFDPAGGRLGRGGGYYDRILAALGDVPVRIGMAFDFQVVSRVPVDRHDERVDAVVTETRCLRCGTRAVA
jgi:5-formyltetrahydrofolate cyclo-ligase